MGSRAGAGAGRDRLRGSKAKLILLWLRGEEEGEAKARPGQKGRDEKDNQSSQYGDKIRSRD
jgi:hypothetical protein